MPLSPEFRARSNAALDTAPEDATVVVATAGPDSHLLMQTRTPTPHGLIAIARALLSQASDELDAADISEADAELLDRVEEALAALPDDAGADPDDNWEAPGR